VRPGHGRHLLDSLGAKLAILGPPRLVAEIPDDLAVAASFFAACGFAPGETLADWVLDDGATLVARAKSLQGLGLATVDRIDAFALYRAAPDGRPGRFIDALGPAAGANREVLPPRPESFRRLLAMVLERTGPPLHLPRLAETELPAEWLRHWGFRVAARRRRYTAAARAG
jgi:hypothetical protein